MSSIGIQLMQVVGVFRLHVHQPLRDPERIARLARVEQERPVVVEYLLVVGRQLHRLLHGLHGLLYLLHAEQRVGPARVRLCVSRVYAYRLVECLPRAAVVALHELPVPLVVLLPGL